MQRQRTDGAAHRVSGHARGAAPPLLLALCAALLALAAPAAPAAETKPGLRSALAALERAHSAGDVDALREAIAAVGRFEDDRAAGALAELLDDADARVWSQAVRALETMATEAAVEALRRAWREGAPAANQALGALARLGRGYSVGEVARVLADPGAAAARQAAADAAAALGGREAFEALFTAYASPEEASDRQVAALNRHLVPLLRGFDPDVGAAWLLGEALGRRATVHGAQLALELLAHWERSGAEAAAARFARAREPGLRAAAVTYLGVLGEEPAVVARAASDRDPAVAVAAADALARFGDDRARRTLRGLLRNRSWEVRAMAVRSLAAIGEADDARRLAGRLDDPAWQVRVAAVEALSGIPTPDSVEALIDHLEDADGREAADVERALVRLTGAELGDRASDWRSWWRAQGEGFVFADLDRPLTGRSRGQGGTVRRGTYYGEEVVSNRVCFIVDISGSMQARMRAPEHEGRTRMDLARDELLKAIDGLPPEAFFNIILFDHRIESWQEQLVQATPQVLEEARAFIRALEPRGATNIFDAVELALLDPAVDTIYLMTDGVPNQGRITDVDLIIEEVARLNRARNVTIHTVNIGGHRRLLETLAEQNGGVFIDVE